MNELLIAGGVVGGLYYMTQANVTPEQQQHAGTAITSAMQVLLAKRPLAGVSWSQDPANPLSATANYGQMRNAMVGQFGELDGYNVGYSVKLPRDLSNDQLVEIATAWLAAYDAGRNTSHLNFALVTGESEFDASGGSTAQALGVNQTCATSSDGTRTSLGNAACALASYRDQLASGTASTAFTDPGETTQEMFRRINALASEMDGADYTANGVRNSEQGWQWSDIPGGIGAAADASVGFVEGLAGDAAGALGGAIVGSNLFWLAGLAFVGYLVLKRGS